jgi:hypothetical protein
MFYPSFCSYHLVDQSLEKVKQSIAYIIVKDEYPIPFLFLFKENLLTELNIEGSSYDLHAADNSSGRNRFLRGQDKYIIFELEENGRLNVDKISRRLFSRGIEIRSSRPANGKSCRYELIFNPMTEEGLHCPQYSRM